MMPTKPVVVITGATSGLGQLAAVELAKRDFHLVLTARSKERAEATKRCNSDSHRFWNVFWSFFVSVILAEALRS
ncbi:SDR family NAD(P)-dependent oxidoreductase [Paenibacillus pinihumi]|uniref:SDR family NAD(P)-dependent oxidoreductase n=1 Tax=Paenibacillus pinihumi TaxID=669462 RepID=UPI000414698E|nr:SDR family NAD(P)-dependent oxidoreductase [Paenibacillus pinihumi]